MRRRDDSPDWMWSDALAALDRMERMHRQVFQPRPARTPARFNASTVART